LPLTTVEPTRLYRQIASQIATLIANGEFRAGGRLPSERELASLLGVSRTSVREAIIALEMAGLVEVHVGTGIFVARRDPSARFPLTASAQDTEGGLSPFELLAARKLIEGETAALAAPVIQRSDVDTLRATVAEMREHADDAARRDAADRDFHVKIAEATRNGAFGWIVGALWDQRRGELWTRLESRFHTPALRAKTLDDHEAIITALAAHDAEGARSAMHRHLARVAREFQRHYEGGEAPAAAAAGKAAAKRAATVARRAS
jgi:GntR family uxuAB operon transcriptional repressor